MQSLMEAAKKASEGGDMSAVTKIAEKQQKETQKRLDPYSPTSFSNRQDRHDAALPSAFVAGGLPVRGYGGDPRVGVPQLRR
jgi:hypothetical protein